MNRNTRTLSFLFLLSIFRTDLHNQRSHIGGHMISHITCHIDVI